MNPALRDLEVLRRHAALGLRFRDVAADTSVIDGLRVEVYPRANPRARDLARPNRSGIYVAHAVPGLREFEFSETPPPALWASALRPYRVEVSDPFGRFVPLAFDADLPVRGLFAWHAPWLSPPMPIVLPGDAGSPPQWLLEHVPLFSAAQRPVPEPLAVVRAQLQEQGAELPAAWALLRVSIDGRPQGIGLADAKGQVAVMFPYPEPPRQSLASPPQPRDDFGWSIELDAFYRVASPPPAAAHADLAAVLAQLQSPRAIVLSPASPPPAPRLEFRVPLTVRTEGGSTLLLSTA